MHFETVFREIGAGRTPCEAMRKPLIAAVAPVEGDA
jgi:hypothetical protein